MVENVVAGELFGTSDHQIIKWNFVACKENIKVANKTVLNFVKTVHKKYIF